MTPAAARVFDTRLEDELCRAAKQHPKAASAYRWLVERRIPLLVAAAVIAGAIYGTGTIVTGDPKLFARAGLLLTSSRWRETFSDPAVQVGPLLLLLYGLGARLARLLGIADFLPVAIAASVTSSPRLRRRDSSVVSAAATSPPGSSFSSGWSWSPGARSGARLPRGILQRDSSRSFG